MEPDKSKQLEIQQELKWVHIQKEKERSVSSRFKSKGILSVLVPVGCIVTAGILGKGLYHMCKKNSKKQQKMMRYRVAAQGVTMIVAAIGVMSLYFDKPKYE